MPNPPEPPPFPSRPHRITPAEITWALRTLYDIRLRQEEIMGLLDGLQQQVDALTANESAEEAQTQALLDALAPLEQMANRFQEGTVVSASDQQQLMAISQQVASASQRLAAQVNTLSTAAAQAQQAGQAPASQPAQPATAPNAEPAPSTTQAGTVNAVGTTGTATEAPGGFAPGTPAAAPEAAGANAEPGGTDTATEAPGVAATTTTDVSNPVVGPATSVETTNGQPASADTQVTQPSTPEPGVDTSAGSMADNTTTSTGTAGPFPGTQEPPA